MKDIPVDAEVMCADGPCGKSLGVLVDTATRRVTHFVVEDETLPRPPYKRLVPVDQVVETTHELVRLGCTRDEVGHMEPFVQTRYVAKQEHDYSMYEGGEGPVSSASTVGVAYVKKEEALIPEGELGVGPGTRVEATDGYVGQVEELLVDPATDQITHLVLREGHLWGKKDVTLPASAVDRVEGDTVYVKLDKQAIEQLPAVPVRLRHRRH